MLQDTDDSVMEFTLTLREIGIIKSQKDHPNYSMKHEWMDTKERKENCLKVYANNPRNKSQFDIWH